MSESDLEWKFSQVFGDRDAIDEGLASEADIVSAVEFDRTGDYIATGDKGGRVVIFERTKESTKSSGRKSSSKGNFEYRFYTEFQSHEPEFDYLKSLEIEEKINKIKWLPSTNSAHFLISTNDKTIKLWKVYEKQVSEVTSNNLEGNSSGYGSKPKSSIQSLKVPQLQFYDKPQITATPKKVFANGHAYHINSISVNSDGETYLSADDLRINLWNLEIVDQSFNIVDIKPANMEELTEVITAADFHPKDCNVFMYSSSKGSIKLADMRDSALCDNYAKIFEEEEDPGNKSFFSEIISSISDIKFSNDGRYILSRDYLTLRVWDINQESKPLKTIQIHEHLRSKLCDLYENDFIFDKFECSFSGDGSHMATGSYHNLFHIYDADGKSDVCVEASKSPPPKKKQSSTKSKITLRKKDNKKQSTDISVDQMDFHKKVLHTGWHPTENVLAVAALNNLYIYTAV